MAAELDILIQVKDQASAELKNLNRELGNVGKQGQTAGGQLGSLEEALGSSKVAAIGFGAGIATAMGTQALGAVTKFANASITSASNLTESLIKDRCVLTQLEGNQGMG